MRTVSTLGFGLAVALAGCGGGAGGGDGGGSQVLGTVESRDGSTEDVGGVLVSCPETGDVAVTDGEGSFVLDVPAGEAFALEFDDPDASSEAGEDCAEGDDPSKDDVDVDGNVVKAEPVGDGEDVRCEVALVDGEVVECRFAKDGEDGADDPQGEARLFPGDAYPDARGELEVRLLEGCAVLEIEVGGFEGPHRFEVVLFHPEGDETLLGVLETGEGGGAHLGLEWCGDRPLPFGVDSAKGLAGFLLLVLDGEGRVVFEGHVPGLVVEDDPAPKGDGKDGGEPGGEDGDGAEGEDAPAK